MARFRNWLRCPETGGLRLPKTGCTLAVAAWALSLMVGASGDPNTPPAYKIIDLSRLANASGLNNTGQVGAQVVLQVGQYGQAYIYDSTGLRSLGSLGSVHGHPIAINDLGQVVGVAAAPSTNVLNPNEWTNHAFLFDGTTMRDLGTLGGIQSHANDINNAGQVIGMSQVVPGEYGDRLHPFIYSNGVMRNMGLPPDLDLTIDRSNGLLTRAINGPGQVLVTIDRWSESKSRIYLWQNGGWQRIQALDNSTAMDINDTGQIIGRTGSGPLGLRTGHAFLYDSTGVRDLGTLGGPSSLAIALNNRGQVVGTAEINGPPPAHPILYQNDITDRPFLFTGGVLHDLTNLLLTSAPWERFTPTAINDRGEILGTAQWAVGSETSPNIRSSYYLLVPDPTARVTVPQAPSGMSVKFVSLRQLDLTWADNSGNEQSFAIERRQSWSDWAPIGSVLPNTKSFSDKSVEPYTHYFYRVRGTNGAGLSNWSNEAEGETGSGAVARLGWTAQDFGSIALGTSSEIRSLTITNRGTAPLVMQSSTLSGTHAGDFAILDSPTTLAPGDTGAIRLRFTPTALGSRSAQLVLRSNATNVVEPIGLTGSGAPQLVPTLSVTPSTVGFGPEPVGLSGTLAVLLHNTGQVTVSIGTISIHGANAEEFTLPLGGCSNSTLAPGAICLLNVRFSPTATGSRSALLMIPTDAVGSPHMVSLTGTGTAPLLRLNTDSLLFTIPTAGQTSASETVTFTNHGDAPLNIEALTLAGPQASSFQIISDSGEESLDPGASRTVKVAFRPAQTNSARRPARIAGAQIASVRYSASLQIRHNDTRPGSPQQVALTAVATAPAAPAPLRAVAASPTQVDLTWSDTSPNEAEFVLMRKMGTGLYARLIVLPPNTTSYTDTAVSPNTAYSYILKAANTIGASPWSNEASATTPVLLPPAAPTPLRATAVGSARVELSWTDRSANESGFVLLRKVGSGVYRRITVLPANTASYMDHNVAPSTTYTYILRALNEAGVSAWTNEPSATTLSAVPAKPANLKAVAVSSTRVNLTWEDRSSNETQFVLLRKIGNGLYQRIAVVGPNTTSYSDTTVSRGVTYTYIMRAVNGAEVSGWSNEPSATMP